MKKPCFPGIPGSATEELQRELRRLIRLRQDGSACLEKHLGARHLRGLFRDVDVTDRAVRGLEVRAYRLGVRDRNLQAIDDRAELRSRGQHRSYRSIEGVDGARCVRSARAADAHAA